MADGGGIDGGARVRLLALVQGVRDLARRAGGNISEVQLAANPSPVVRAALAAVTAHDVVATATADDRAALAVRVARRLSDFGSPGAEANGTAQLRAILGRVAGPETDRKEPPGSPDARFVPMKPLGKYDEATLFPKAAMSASDLARALRETWEGFKDDHTSLPASSLEGYLDSLGAALQKYAWCVPAIPIAARAGGRDDRERGSNDVSVADHARVTAAIAVALHAEDAAGTIDLAALASGDSLDVTPCLALIGGDVSGVQRYLYTITSRRALRGLRGRSFYLQLLGEAVVRHLREALGLPPTSVLLEGGGHFYLLAPLSAVTHGQLATAVGEVSAVLLRHHGADLGVAVAHVALAAADLTGSGLSRRWVELGQALSRAKARKGGALDPETLVNTLFSAKPSEGLTHHYCATCQSRIDDAPDQPPDPEGNDDRVNCARCQGMEDIGDRLRLGTTLLTWDAHPEDDPDPDDRDPRLWRSQRWRRALRELGMDAVVVGGPYRRNNDGLPPLGSRVTAWRLSDTDLKSANGDASRLASRLARSETAVGFRLVAQATPMEIDAESRDGSRVAELSELAEAGTGVARLGFLRADVDNLGGVIQSGLRRGPGANDDGGTLARRIALSQSLRLFFEGHLGVICAPRNPAATALRERRDPGTAKDRLYLIYSGGDDLFLAGAWDTVAEAGATVAESLGKYAGGNPAIHLSAGLAIVHDKYPVRQAAEDAGEALDQAKALPAGTAADEPAKNAIAAFGEVVPWATLRRARELAAKLQQAVRPSARGASGDESARDDQAPRQVIRLALRLCAMEAQAREAIEEREADRAKARDDRGDPPVEEPRDEFRRNRRERQVAWGSWMWLGQYALGRMQGRRRDEGASEEVVRLVRNATTSPQGMAELRIGATWADLAIRKRESRGQGER